ncbi:zinc finger BED domain-containing protein RICESLEEPER 1-like [Lathyrus oleraceus]|uniref:zinc finger BED domain-containing protein RICESLEEPER 1-like n=1 Tax=Pisum sativum TaxID=3888 RepID=UPI0021D26DF0|nr:zinc finger BED domain-containing protein RICESLEEPER 1-like [Pisum sativum]
MKVEDVLREWGLRKVSTITLDNATANDVAVSYLDRRLKRKNALLGVGDYLHMRCAAHVLNLVVRDGEKEHEGSIESVRTAVRFVRSSPQRAMKFKECVELAGITCKKKLCLDVSTRGNSTYLMLDAAEKFEAAFDNMIDEDPGYIEYFDLLTGPPGSQDWKKVRAFMVFVKYDKYWGDVGKVNHFLYYGVIFDPRFKFNYIEWSFNDMYGHSSDLAKKNIECVKTSLFKLYNWHKSDHDKNVGASPLSAPGSTSLGEASSQPKEPSPFTRANAFKKHLKEKDTIENENELENNLGSGCVGNTCF